MNFCHWRLRHLLWIFSNMNVSGLHLWSVNIGSGNGLVPSGNKPLLEPILTQICRHMASLGYNELIHWDLNKSLSFLQIKFSNAFPCEKTYLYLFIFVQPYFEGSIDNAALWLTITLTYCFYLARIVVGRVGFADNWWRGWIDRRLDLASLGMCIILTCKLCHQIVTYKGEKYHLITIYNNFNVVILEDENIYKEISAKLKTNMALTVDEIM